MILLCTLVFTLLISWAVTIGLIKLITLLLGVTFSLAIATGVWIALLLLKWVFGGGKS